jgi:subtilisin-like proprotein convertase family protein
LFGNWIRIDESRCGFSSSIETNASTKLILGLVTVEANQNATAVVIPDNGGAVVSEIAIDKYVLIRYVGSDVRFMHPYIGDLTVKLIAPGRSVNRNRLGKVIYSFPKSLKDTSESNNG